ncbi:MAG TPA: UDP-galactopyranose mutase [Urbifossiella sp.]
MLDDVDLLICGAGPVGCVIAERAANILGWKVLIVDKRRHIAGNCFDSLHNNGVLIHNYGPHYFRTNDDALLKYLSRFTEWIPAHYEVRSCVNGKEFPFPINLTTLEQFYSRELNAKTGARLLQGLRINIERPRNSEEVVLNRVGRELYEAFYKNYTIKQWGRDPNELDAEVCGRVPVRLNRDVRYVDHKHQVMPRLGFTALFSKMLGNRKIRVLLDCPFSDVRQRIRPRQATVYSGPIDDYFECRFGKLPYRSLQFEFVPHQKEYVQPCVQINYPNEHEYTRSVEIKHVTRQKHAETVVSYETPISTGEPFYPILQSQNRMLYDRYRDLAEREARDRSVYFCGRLAQYRYFNTDEVIQEAMTCFQQIRQHATTRRKKSASCLPIAAA